jgi:hypothetical protein
LTSQRFDVNADLHPADDGLRAVTGAGVPTDLFLPNFSRGAVAKQFFFEKKNQKTFASLAYASG